METSYSWPLFAVVVWAVVCYCFGVWVKSTLNKKKIAQLKALNKDLLRINRSVNSSNRDCHGRVIQLEADLKRHEDKIRYYPDSYLGKIFFQGVECGKKQLEERVRELEGEIAYQESLDHEQTISDVRHVGCP